MMIQSVVLEPTLIQFSVESLLIFVACILGIGLAILLISVLWNMRKVTGMVRSILETNLEAIHRTVRAIPNIAENVEQISINIIDTTDTFNESFPDIIEDAASITNSAKDSIETANSVIENLGCGIVDTVSSYKKDADAFGPYLHIIEEVVQIIVRALLPKKK